MPEETYDEAMARHRRLMDDVFANSPDAQQVKFTEDGEPAEDDGPPPGTGHAEFSVHMTWPDGSEDDFPLGGVYSDSREVMYLALAHFCDDLSARFMAMAVTEIAEVVFGGDRR